MTRGSRSDHGTSGVRNAVLNELVGLSVTFDHAAVAAPRLRDLLPVYQDLLGGRLVLGADNRRVGFRLIQFGYENGTKMELLEPLGDSTFLDSFFRRTRGVGGLHHITFEVDSVLAAVRRMEALGYRPVGLFLDDEVQQEVFLHPAEAAGTLVQLVQRGRAVAWPAMTTEDVLAGRGLDGNGVSSP